MGARMRTRCASLADLFSPTSAAAVGRAAQKERAGRPSRGTRSRCRRFGSVYRRPTLVMVWSERCVLESLNRLQHQVCAAREILCDSERRVSLFRMGSFARQWAARDRCLDACQDPDDVGKQQQPADEPAAAVDCAQAARSQLRRARRVRNSALSAGDGAIATASPLPRPVPGQARDPRSPSGRAPAFHPRCSPHESPNAIKYLWNKPPLRTRLVASRQLPCRRLLSDRLRGSLLVSFRCAGVWFEPSSAH